MNHPSFTNSRFELKYRIHYFTYLKIRNAVRMYMKKDKFTRQSPGKGYLVRSLYFDTHDYSAYHEKMSGDNERIKFRIRTYHHQLEDHTPIRVELKGRKSGLVIKKSCFISPLSYRNFIEKGCFGEHDNPVMEEFIRFLHLKTLQPKIITKYYREGYETKFKNDLRITFDHEVQSTHSTTLFPENTFYRQHHHNGVIMEIKFKEEPAVWVRQLVHHYGLKTVANSKFTQGIQVSRKDLYHPGGIVTVR
ncbi:polyphosphate polymerase domain-containing protein [Alkalitalea saponilacus]|uniref:VTC domain-containing protein n=1 Tax=Alkalitalea saponilacus TaxID=889453 RepID=A0A1T5GZV9_9BACT|nr:polyphosphate polymerase domain-containing protein [Alkalitalea saponilacus]ASB50962.1 hypothetical protein CDL62_18320 [Alkalitalea saponilacus]SKC13938.1 VTC domain-containing protein [Alkalitalea saponilacus]